MWMYLSLLNNLMHPCLISVSISKKKPFWPQTSEQFIFMSWTEYTYIIDNLSLTLSLVIVFFCIFIHNATFEFVQKKVPYKAAYI